jgi:uncharacterized protein YuzE
MEGLAVKLTYDRDADAAYIYLIDIQPGQLDGGEVIVADTGIEQTALLIERDSRKRLLGIEILGASKLLHPDTIAATRDDD